MKKKMLSLLLASAIATTAMGLAACGDDDYNGLKSDKIASAEAWSAAFDFSEVSNVTITAHGMEGNNNVDVFAFDGSKHYESTLDHETSEFFERYYDYKDDEIFDEQYPRGTEYRYYYDEQTSAWKVERGMIFDKETAESIFTDCVDELTAEFDDQGYWDENSYMHARFSDFTYDESKYAYVAHFDTINDYYKNMNISVKFKNGKVAECEATAEFDDDGVSRKTEIKIVISKRGTTTVTLPSVQ
ncbi:MAG: hypothetical protein K2L54_03705 [Clostridiales bacterium]|nr:hypothetical protein [Clostridiales bacterium]